MNEHDEKTIARRILHEAVIEMCAEGVEIETAIGCMVSCAVALMARGTSVAAAADMLRKMADMTDREAGAPSGKAH